MHDHTLYMSNMSIQYTDALVRSHIFSIPMWLLCSWSSICICNEKGMIIHLVFITTLSIIASFSLWASIIKEKVLSCLCSVANLLLCISVAYLFLHLYLLHFWCPLQICILRHLLLCWVCACWCSYQLFPGLCLQCDCDGIASLLCIDLVQDCMLCTHCTVVCTILCAVVAVIRVVLSLVTISAQWFVICDHIYFPGEAVVVELLRPYSMPMVPHPMLPYCWSILDSLWLMNVIGCNVVLFGTSSHLAFMPSLTCKRPDPRPILDASVARCEFGQMASKSLASFNIVQHTSLCLCTPTLCAHPSNAHSRLLQYFLGLWLFLISHQSCHHHLAHLSTALLIICQHLCSHAPLLLFIVCPSIHGQTHCFAYAVFGIAVQVWYSYGMAWICCLAMRTVPSWFCIFSFPLP